MKEWFLRNTFLNDISEGNDFMSSLKLFLSSELLGKNVLLCGKCGNTRIPWNKT